METTKRGWERALISLGPLSGLLIHLVTTLRGPSGSMWMGNDTGRTPNAPATKEKVIKPQRRGEPPSAPQKWGNSGKEMSRMGRTQRDRCL